MTFLTGERGITATDNEMKTKLLAMRKQLVKQDLQLARMIGILTLRINESKVVKRTLTTRENAELSKLFGKEES